MKFFKIKKNIFNINFIISMLFIISLLGATVGFGLYGQLVSVNGIVTIDRKMVEVTKISEISSSNVSGSSPPEYNKLNAKFDIDFYSKAETPENLEIKYEVTVINYTDIDYIYQGVTYENDITITSGSYNGILNVVVTGIENGTHIAPGGELTFTVTLQMDVDEYGSSYNVKSNVYFNFSWDDSGELLGSITPNEGDLRGDRISDAFNLEVINTYKYSRSFGLLLSNENFLVTDVNGKPINSLGISANETKNYSVYIIAKEDSVFLNDTYTTTLYITGNEINNVNVGDILLYVDKKEEEVIDKEKPVVGNATLVFDPDNIGRINVNWNRIDTGGTSIVNYTILLYKDGSYYNTYNTNSDITSYTINDIEEGNYYAVIYGTDEAGNSGINDVNSATTENGYATKTGEIFAKWIYTVTVNTDSYLSHNGQSTATLNKTYSLTFSLTNGNRRLPSSVNVVMNGVTLVSGTDYNYSSGDGSLTINNVTGDIIISAESRNAPIGCLVSGTLVSLANGKVKKIEDIKYNDLIEAYSYELGEIVYEYPMWIEKKGISDSYLEIKLENGTILKTVNEHSLYSYDINKFVCVFDKDNFKVGTKVAIKDKNNKVVPCMVTSIKKVEEKVDYYQILSTRYYNSFANNVLVTDGETFVSNLYGFNDDITWPKVREDYISDSNNLYTYDELKDVIPYYLYKSSRACEGKYLTNFGITMDLYKEYLKTNLVNYEILLDPDKVDGKNVWEVSTSDGDKTNVFEKDKYKLNEPKIKENFLGWYNTADGRIYNPSCEVEIFSGTYFEALYKE